VLTRAFFEVKQIFSRNQRFLLYCLIGATGASFDFLVYSGLLKTFAIPIQIANAAGYFCGTILSFILNARFNFKTRDFVALRFVSFCGVGFIGWASSAAFLYLLVNRFGFDKYLSKLMTIVVVVLVQYNLNRLLSFRKAEG
jgi:putative flippase GtrA